MKTKILFLFFSMAICFTSCNSDVLVEPTASFTPDSLEFNAGSEILLRYSGDCDYVTFWSGEEGSIFKNRHRIEANVDSAYLKFDNYTVYGLIGQPRPLSVYISNSFKADYSELGINDVSTRWDTITPVNTPNYMTSSVATPSGKINITKYANAPFFIAFKYVSDSMPGSTRFVTIKNLELLAYTEAGLINSNLVTQFGFIPVSVKGPSIWNRGANDINIRGSAQTWEEDWFITKEFDLKRVNSDKAIAVKTLSNNISDFRYIYKKPGVYNATLELLNSRYGETKVVYQHITFTVK